MLGFRPRFSYAPLPSPLPGRKPPYPLLQMQKRHQAGRGFPISPRSPRVGHLQGRRMGDACKEGLQIRMHAPRGMKGSGHRSGSHPQGCFPASIGCNCQGWWTPKGLVPFMSLSLKRFAWSMWHAIRLWNGSGCQMLTAACKIHLSIKFQNHLPDAILSMQRTYFNEFSYTF